MHSPSTSKHDTLVAVATYNEIENLPDLVDSIFLHVPKSDLLIIDDGSPDGTGKWCDKKSQEESRLRCIHREEKLGLGTAMIAAMQYAIAQEYSFLVILDGDFSHDPESIPRLLEAVQSESINADVAIGSRYIQGGSINGWPWKRHFMSRCINLYARIMLSLPVKDCSGSFRCYRVSQLKELPFDNIVSHGYSFFEEILWRLHRADSTFHEVPITFTERIKGASKITLKVAYRAVWVMFRLGCRNWLGF
ncbi:MAG: polyprenol monophosphomannose synthase [Pirellulales bacterium]|jgi:dolichol-phosphate mannosyltransferase